MLPPKCASLVTKLPSRCTRTLLLTTYPNNLDCISKLNINVDSFIMVGGAIVASYIYCLNEMDIQE